MTQQGRPLPRSTRWLAVALAIVMAGGLLAAAAPSTAAAEGTCSGIPSNNLGTARTNYNTGCNDTWDSQSGFHRCDWQDAGWVCSGPGTPTSERKAPLDNPAAEISAAPVDAAPGGPCAGAPSNDLGTARTNYNIDCNDTWDSQSGLHRCDWEDAGWVCTGPPAPTGSGSDASPAPTDQAELPALREVLDLRLRENYLAQITGPFLHSKTLSWRDNGNNADGYNILRNGDYWTTLDNSKRIGDYYAVNDREFDKTVVYEVQAYRHTATGHEWGPRSAVAVLRSRKSIEATAATGNSPVSELSAERANTANEAAAAARTEADEQYDQFIQALVPQTNVDITIEVDFPNGPSVGVSLNANFDLNQIVTEGTEAWNADDVADDLEAAATEAQETHEQCLADADSCPFGLIERPTIDDGCSTDCPPDTTRPPGCNNNNGDNGGKGEGGDAYSGDPAYGSSDGC